MIDHCSAPPFATRVSSLYLDYGADEQECGTDTLEITEQGMVIRSRWHFEMATQLSLAFVCGRHAAGGERFTVEALVVSCEPSTVMAGMYESMLLFMEIPDALRRSLRSV